MNWTLPSLLFGCFLLSFVSPSDGLRTVNDAPKPIRLYTNGHTPANPLKEVVSFPEDLPLPKMVFLNLTKDLCEPQKTLVTFGIANSGKVVFLNQLVGNNDKGKPYFTPDGQNRLICVTTLQRIQKEDVCVQVCDTPSLILTPNVPSVDPVLYYDSILRTLQRYIPTIDLIMYSFNPTQEYDKSHLQSKEINQRITNAMDLLWGRQDFFQRPPLLPLTNLTLLNVHLPNDVRSKDQFAFPSQSKKMPYGSPRSQLGNSMNYLHDFRRRLTQESVDDFMMDFENKLKPNVSPSESDFMSSTDSTDSIVESASSASETTINSETNSQLVSPLHVNDTLSVIHHIEKQNHVEIMQDAYLQEIFLRSQERYPGTLPILDNSKEAVLNALYFSPSSLNTSTFTFLHQPLQVLYEAMYAEYLRCETTFIQLSSINEKIDKQITSLLDKANGISSINPEFVEHMFRKSQRSKHDSFLGYLGKLFVSFKKYADLPDNMNPYDVWRSWSAVRSVVLLPDLKTLSRYTVQEILQMSDKAKLLYIQALYNNCAEEQERLDSLPAQGHSYRLGYTSPQKECQDKIKAYKNDIHDVVNSIRNPKTLESAQELGMQYTKKTTPKTPEELQAEEEEEKKKAQKEKDDLKKQKEGSSKVSKGDNEESGVFAHAFNSAGKGLQTSWDHIKRQGTTVLKHATEISPFFEKIVVTWKIFRLSILMFGQAYLMNKKGELQKVYKQKRPQFIYYRDYIRQFNKAFQRHDKIIDAIDMPLDVLASDISEETTKEMLKAINRLRGKSNRSKTDLLTDQIFNRVNEVEAKRNRIIQERLDTIEQHQSKMTGRARKVSYRNRQSNSWMNSMMDDSD